MADQRAADRPHQIAEREHAEGRKELRDGILVRKEVAADRGGEIAVDREIVPFEHVADHTGGDHAPRPRGSHVVVPPNRAREPRQL
jgi:hypothetical protein